MPDLLLAAWQTLVITNPTNVDFVMSCNDEAARHGRWASSFISNAKARGKLPYQECKGVTDASSCKQHDATLGRLCIVNQGYVRVLCRVRYQVDNRDIGTHCNRMVGFERVQHNTALFHVPPVNFHFSIFMYKRPQGANIFVHKLEVLFDLLFYLNGYQSVSYGCSSKTLLLTSSDSLCCLRYSRSPSAGSSIPDTLLDSSPR